MRVNDASFDFLAPGLVLGYVGLGTAELRRGVQTLGRALRSIQEE